MFKFVLSFATRAESLAASLIMCSFMSGWSEHAKSIFIIVFLAHGTFLGHIRLEAHKPQQIPIDSTMSFGASTRTYTIREKPQSQGTSGSGEKTGDDEELKGLLGLPEEETELEVPEDDILTNFQLICRQ